MDIKKDTLDSQPSGSVPESAENIPQGITASIRAKLMENVKKHGVSGLLLYSAGKGVVVFGVASSACPGEMNDKLEVGAAAGSVAIISGQTFWLAMTVLGKRAYSRFLSS